MLMTPDLSAIEAEWLVYARSVVLGDHHTGTCVRSGGGCLESGGAPQLRWPGYIGPLYKSGGLLLVGNVHRNFASGGVPEWVPSLLIRTTQALRRDPTGHSRAYLSDIRRAYERGLTGDELGTWKVARPFDYLLRGLGMVWEEVVYTNASKSQLIPGADLGRLVHGCLDEWPVDELADRVGASVVITCSSIARDRLLDKGFAFEYFPQRFSYARLDEIIDAVRSRIQPG